MTRSRSGSFYCPVEPSLGPLSITQKAAISAPCRPSPTTIASLPSPAFGPSRHRRSGCSLGGGDAGGRSVVGLATSVSGITQGADSFSSTSSSLPMSTNTLRNIVPSFQNKGGFAMGPITTGTSSHLGASGFPAVQRHQHSPARPSPLRRQVNAPKPLCPSALWTSQKELLPLYYANTASQYYTPVSSSHCSRSSSKSGLRRSVLKSTFLAGPMAQKCKLYGLRVAWCVFGDVKDEMARDIFGPQETLVQSAPAPVMEERHDQDGLDHVFVEHDETVDSDESSSDSEYSGEEDEDTASEESDDLELDDEEQVERDMFDIFASVSMSPPDSPHSISFDKVTTPHVVAAADDASNVASVGGGWEVISLQV